MQDISGLVGEQQVNNLSLHGRSYDLLLLLNPGIVSFTSLKTGGTGIWNSLLQITSAVSGSRPQQHLFLLNGVKSTGAAEHIEFRAEIFNLLNRANFNLPDAVVVHGIGRFANGGSDRQRSHYLAAGTIRS
jgi:hypothetical protein